MGIGIGFIGGGFARRVQAPAFGSIPDVNLVGVASPSTSNEFAEEFRMPLATTDWKKLIDDERVDLVCISSPPALHFDQALYALNRGKHVLCEKPFTLTTSQARILSEEAAKVKTLALIDHELRFTPSVLLIRRMMQNYELGEVFFAKAESHLTFRNNPEHPWNWWSEKSKGGGSWGAIGSHLIDLLRHLVDEITAADTMLSTSYKKRKDKNGQLQAVTSDDIASSVIRFRSGAGGTIITSTVSTQTSMDIVITGEKGSLSLDIEGNVTLHDLKGNRIQLTPELTAVDKEIEARYLAAEIKARNKFSKAFFYYSDAIIRCIRNGDRTMPGAATFEDGYLTQQVLESGWETP